MSRDILELGSSLAYLDELHAQYSEQPGDVDASWHALLNGSGGVSDAVRTASRPRRPRHP